MSKSISLQELAELTQARLDGNPLHSVSEVAPIDESDETCITFLANPRYASKAANTKASAIFLTEELSRGISLPEGISKLVVENPSWAFQIAVHWFLDARKTPSVFQGIHPTAVIGPNVEIAVDVSIAPYVVIDQHCSIGEGTHIGPFVSVGPGCRIGKQCHLHAHAVLREGTILGDRVIVQPGAVLGSCGYGYMTDAQGHHTKLPQLGIVSIGDDVEIGANTTIDRARFRKTIVGRGTKVDNLVQVAHNVEIGEHNLIVSQVGMAGSSKTGDHCILGGQGAVVGHVELDPHVILTARAAASKNLTKGVYSGAPALPHHEHMRQSVEIRRLGKLVAQINSLETKIKDLIQTNNSVTMS